MNCKKHVIERIAAENLANELLKTPNFHFTNACYGCKGTVMGTIEMKKPHQEHQIQIVLERDGDWSSDKYNLVKVYTGRYYKCAKHDKSEYETKELIKTFYLINDDVYSDNEEDARKASKLNTERYQRRNHRLYGHRTKTTILRPNTKLYDKIFTECAKIKNIKYGTELEYIVERHDSYRYEGDFGNYKKVGITQVSRTVYFDYRNKRNSLSRGCFTYNNPHAEF